MASNSEGRHDDWAPQAMICDPQTLVHYIVKKAREHGGDAVIVISSSSQLAGYYTSGTVKGCDDNPRTEQREYACEVSHVSKSALEC